MITSKYTKYFSALMCIILISNSLLITPVFADTDELQQEIDQNNSKIDELEKEKEDINSAMYTMQSELDIILDDITKKSKDLASIQEKITDYSNSITEKENQIKSISDDIEIKENEIKTKEEEYNKRKKMMDNRVRSYYKSNITTEIITLLISANNFNDLLSKVNTLNKLISLDKTMMKDIKEMQDELSLIKEDLEVLLKNVKIEKSELEGIKKSLELEKQTFEVEMESLNNLEKQKQYTLQTLSDKEKSLVKSISDLTNENEELEKEIQKILNQNSINNGVSTESSFIRPISGYISSTFGSRTDPIDGSSSYHKGIDYASGYGTPIAASKSGTVIYAGYNGGYGQCVMIDHGDGYVTLYGHMQDYYVSYGQTISQGEILGEVGSTGWSTGPHLHFEIRKDGVPLDPYSFIPY